MGNTEQNQAKVMKRYIREMFIPQYVKSFNKGLFETDIKFYGKIHSNRSHSDNELNALSFDCEPERSIQQEKVIPTY